MAEQEPVGERVARVETRLVTVEGEVKSLRDTRHEHARHLQLLFGVPDEVEALQQWPPRIEAVENAMEAMTERVVPELRRTLEQHAEEIKKTRESEMKSGMNIGWVMKLLGTVGVSILAIGQALVIYLLTHR